MPHDLFAFAEVDLTCDTGPRDHFVAEPVAIGPWLAMELQLQASDDGVNWLAYDGDGDDDLNTAPGNGNATNT